MIWRIATTFLPTFQSFLQTHCTECFKYGRRYTILWSYCIALHGVLFTVFVWDLTQLIVLRHFGPFMAHDDDRVHDIAVVQRVFRLMTRCYNCRLASSFFSYIPVVKRTLSFSFLLLLGLQSHCIFPPSFRFSSILSFSIGMVSFWFKDEGAVGDNARNGD